MRHFYLFIYIFISLFTSSCSKDNQDTSISFGDIDQRLVPYFERFEQEAIARGLSINIADNDLRAIIEDIPEQNVAGLCTYNSALPNQITIDEGFFSRSSFLYNEFIIFHELGHCVLNRNHDESSNIRGTCNSIMRSGLGNCRDNYTNDTRELYLDELFSSTQP